MFLAFPRSQNIVLGTIIISETPGFFADFAVILVHSACLTKKSLLTKVSACDSISTLLLLLAALYTAAGRGLALQCSS